MIDLIKKKLAHSSVRDLDIDDPRMTIERGKLLKENRFLYRIYLEWYTLILNRLPKNPDPVLEIGSGSGFLREIYPNLITSETFFFPGISVTLDGQYMPFLDSSIGSIIMTDVLHHIPQPRRFFHEVVRCLKPGGKVIMIEPYVTLWSRFVYVFLHHEPFSAETKNWEFPPVGPLSGANIAMPWIIFNRDIKQFEMEFPELRLKSNIPMMPFLYLMSGGANLRGLMPDWTYSFWHLMDYLLPSKAFGMFALIELERREIT